MISMKYPAIIGLLLLLSLLLLPASWAVEVVVYKSPTCGCCKKWVKHMQENGFKMISRDIKDVVPYKIKHGVTPQLASCHTAIVNGYVIEGHVPADDVKRLLKDRPPVLGLSAPGMPVGSPGMEQGKHKDRYDVVTFDKQGNTTVYSRH